jgi:uncharacterized protein YndB with AHSA1/START domain
MWGGPDAHHRRTATPSGPSVRWRRSGTVRLSFVRTVEAPIADVFERLARIGDYDTWLPTSVLYRRTGLVDPDGDVEVGTEFFDDTTVGTLHGTVTALEAPTRLEFDQILRWSGRRVFESTPRYRLEAADRGTRVTHSGEARVFGPLTLLIPAVFLMAQRERRRTVAALQRSFDVS